MDRDPRTWADVRWTVPTWRTSREQGVALAAALGALAVGILVGVLLARHSDLAGGSSASVPRPLTVAVGAIDPAHDSASTGWDFELPVHNSTDEVVSVSLIELEGVSSPARSAELERIAPDDWRLLHFSLSPNCDTPVSDDVSTVKLRIEGTSRSRVVSLPLPGEGQVLLDYLQAVCATGSPVTPADLAGVWILEQAYGPQTDLAGNTLVRFAGAGAFTVDPDGRLLSGDPAQRGHYLLSHGLMTITATNAFGCGAGARAVWRVAHQPGSRLSMVYVNGDCPEGEQGNVWLLRRVIRDEGLPGS
jgi:hypothetical protein